MTGKYQKLSVTLYIMKCSAFEGLSGHSHTKTPKKRISCYTGPRTTSEFSAVLNRCGLFFGRALHKIKITYYKRDSNRKDFK